MSSERRRLRNGRSRSSSKVVDANQKRVWNFLLVIHSNFGPILPPCQRYCRFSAEAETPPYSTRTLGLFTLDLIAEVVALKSEDPKLIIRVLLIPYFRSNPTCIATVLQRHKQTDRQTDGRLTIAASSRIMHRAVKKAKRYVKDAKNIMKLLFYFLTDQRRS